MGSFRFLTIFLIFWHPKDPWICIRSVWWKWNLKQIEAMPSNERTWPYNYSTKHLKGLQKLRTGLETAIEKRVRSSLCLRNLHLIAFQQRARTMCLVNLDLPWFRWSWLNLKIYFQFSSIFLKTNEITVRQFISCKNKPVDRTLFILLKMGHN